MQCPYCKEDIHDEAIKCKHCGSAVGPGSMTPAVRADDFGSAAAAVFAIWKDNLTDLVLLTLVFLLVCWIPFANVGFIAGYTRSLIRLSRGKGRVAVGDIFSAWDCFGSLFTYLLLLVAASVILHFIPVIGSFATLALGFLSIPGTFAIIDRKFGVIDAAKWGIASIQGDFTNWLLAYLIGTILVLGGVMALVIFSVLTVPFAQLLLIQQYQRMRT